MSIIYPKPPNDPSIPQWWVFSLEINRRLRSLSTLWRLGAVSIVIHYRSTDLAAFYPQNWARPSRFYVIRLNNPDKLHPGQTAKILKLICVNCGLEYPCPPNLDTDIKCDCCLARKTCVVLWWGRNKQPRRGEKIYKNSREFII